MSKAKALSTIAAFAERNLTPEELLVLADCLTAFIPVFGTEGEFAFLEAARDHAEAARAADEAQMVFRQFLKGEAPNA